MGSESGEAYMFLARLREIARSDGARLLVGDAETRRYRFGFRCGGGPALAVVEPGSLLAMWRVLELCVAWKKAVVIQAANTGLTGGSTPAAGGYDRDVVIVNTLRIKGMFMIDGGRQVICLAGVRLHDLERALSSCGREPHSVIGSSCIGASVVGGVCNNSGGSLVQRGPAFTEFSLFARVDESGVLRLVNHLGVSLGHDPEEILRRLDEGNFTAEDVENESGRAASDRNYAQRVRAVHAPSPARFNSCTQQLFEASGCAGKIAVFALRLDTFAKEEHSQVFYVGTQDAQELTRLRRVMLSQLENLPVAAEYLHRDMFRVAQRYGKDAFLTIKYLGTERLPRFFAIKRGLDTLLSRIGLDAGMSDQLLQWASYLFPSPLPKRVRDFGERFEHQLLLKMAGAGVAEAEQCLRSVVLSGSGDFFICSEAEGVAAFRHRFVAAGAAMRYAAVHRAEVEDVLALDIALRRNERDWFEVLPEDVRAQLDVALYYGHFFCHVFHQDYIVRKGCDAQRVKERLLALLDARGAQYPAEHNVGHAYRARPELVRFYRTLDPTNTFNPGIGQTSKLAGWRE